MIVKITFSDNRVMLFGDSYKPWTMQVEEYLWISQVEPIKFESCRKKWIGWGGLKWCREESFQHQLNREGTQCGEPDNPKPRQFKDMKFVESKNVENKVKKMVRWD